MLARTKCRTPQNSKFGGKGRELEVKNTDPLVYANKLAAPTKREGLGGKLTTDRWSSNFEMETCVGNAHRTPQA